MPPKPRAKPRAKPQANDFEQLYGPPVVDLAAEARNREDQAAKRRRLVNGSAVFHIGPKFRDAHVTQFRGTNSSVILSQTTDGPSLYDYILDGK